MMKGALMLVSARSNPAHGYAERIRERLPRHFKKFRDAMGMKAENNFPPFRRDQACLVAINAFTRHQSPIAVI